MRFVKTSSDFLKRVLNVFSGKYYGLRNPILRFGGLGGLSYMSDLSSNSTRTPTDHSGSASLNIICQVLLETFRQCH